MSAHSELFNLGGRTNLPRLPNFTQLVTLSTLIVLTLLPHTAQGKTHKKEIKTAQNVHLNVLDMAVYMHVRRSPMCDLEPEFFGHVILNGTFALKVLSWQKEGQLLGGNQILLVCA